MVFFVASGEVDVADYSRGIKRLSPDTSKNIAGFDYSNQHLKQWNILPQDIEFNQVIIKFDRFHLECDYDYVSITIGEKSIGGWLQKAKIYVTIAIQIV